MSDDFQLPSLTVPNSALQPPAQDKDGNEPIAIAAAQGDIATINARLAKGDNINARNNVSRTPLHLAAEKSRSDVVALLLSKGAMFLPDQDGNTPLHLVALANDKKSVGLMLDAKADIDAINNLGKSVLHKAAEGCTRIGDSSLVRDLLKFQNDPYPKAPKPKIVADNDGYTIVHWAAGAGTVSLQATQSRSQVEVATKAGRTPIFFAVANRRDDVVKFLLRVWQANVNVVDNNGNTLLHVAGAELGDPDMCKLLMDKGLSKDAKNKAGNTPLMAAMFAGWTNGILLSTLS